MPKTKKTNGRKRRGKKNRTEKYKKRLRKKLETRKKFPLKSPNQNYQKKTSSRRAELLRKMFNMSMASYNRESTPKSIPTPGTQVTPNLLRLVDQTSPTTSAKKPPPQKTPPVNLSFNINNVMSPRKMGPRLPTVRCSGRLTEEKCKEDKNCKWDYGAKKCREKPPSLNLNI